MTYTYALLRNILLNSIFKIFEGDTVLSLRNDATTKSKKKHTPAPCHAQEKMLLLNFSCQTFIGYSVLFFIQCIFSVPFLYNCHAVISYICYISCQVVISCMFHIFCHPVISFFSTPCILFAFISHPLAGFVQL